MDYIDSLRDHYRDSGFIIGKPCTHKYPHIASSQCPGRFAERAKPLIHEDGTICWHNVMGEHRYHQLVEDSPILKDDNC